MFDPGGSGSRRHMVWNTMADRIQLGNRWPTLDEGSSGGTVVNKPSHPAALSRNCTIGSCAIASISPTSRLLTVRVVLCGSPYKRVPSFGEERAARRAEGPSTVNGNDRCHRPTASVSTTEFLHRCRDSWTPAGGVHSR